MKSIKYALAATSLALVTACGGGGSGGANVAVEGAWQGTTSNNFTVELLALENNEFYTIFGTMSGSNLLVRGFDQGTYSVSGSSISGSFREYPNYDPSYTGTLTGTAVASTSITGTTTYTAGSSTFSGTPIPTSSFNYNRAASINDIQGSWTGSIASAASGGSATVTISPTGVIAGTSSGCLFGGTATPRSSGKNVFNVSITFGAAPCDLAGQTATGIAIDYAITATSQTQLIVAVQDSSKQYGAMFFAHR